VGSIAKKTTQKIMRLIAENSGINRKELADQTGMGTDIAKYHLDKMRKQSLIRRIGPDRGGHWEVIH